MMKRKDGPATVFAPLIRTGDPCREKRHVLYGVVRAHDAAGIPFARIAAAVERLEAI